MAKRTRSTYDDDDDAPRSKSKLDPIILGLINRLPAANSEWPENERKQWLQLIEAAFKVVYESGETTGTPLST